MAARGKTAGAEHGGDGGAGERGEAVVQGMAAEGATREREDKRVGALGGERQGVAAETGDEPAAAFAAAGEEREQGGHADQRQRLGREVRAKIVVVLPPEYTGEAEGDGRQKRATSEAIRDGFA